MSPHAPTADIQFNAKRPLGFAGEPGWSGGKADMRTAAVRFLASAGSPFSSKAVVYEHILSLTIVQELCESRDGRPGLSVLTSLLVSVDVKLY